MRKPRLGVLPAECLVKQVVQRQGRQPFLPADDFRYLHQMVVHDIGQMVCRQFVGPFPEHLVVQCVRIHLYVPANQVIHLHDPVFRHPETDGPVRVRLQKRSPFALRHGQGVPQGLAGDVVVYESLLPGFHLFPFRGEFFRGVEGIVRISLFHQFLCVFPVDASPLGLSVRRMRMLVGSRFHHIPVLVHALVRYDSAPVQGFDDIFFGPRHEPVRVRILDSYDEIASMLFRIEVVVKRSPDTAHMQRSCRRRREPHSCFPFHISFPFSMFS